jgi:hypothetical protein
VKVWTAVLLVLVLTAACGKGGPREDEVSFVVSVNAAGDPTRAWIVDKPLEGVPARPGWSEDWREWASQAGAAPSSALTVLFTMQGKAALTQVKVKVTQRRAPLKGTQFVLVGGDPVSYQRVEADLDKDPVATPIQPGGDDTFAVTVQTQQCDCDWVLEVTWSASGRSGTRTIDNGGKPFRVTATTGIVGRCATYPDRTEKCEKF